MITISTRELVGLLKDVSPFADTNPDSPNSLVRLEWDGERLAASATNRVQVARETWTPDDEQYDVHAEDNYVDYEVSTDTPLFSVRIDLVDVKSLIKGFTIKGVKRQHAPIEISLTVASVEDNTYAVRFERKAGEEWTALVITPTGIGAPREGEPQEIDLESTIAKAQNIEAHLPGVAFNASLLAAFGKVRCLGPLELAFTGEYEVVRFRMGPRFTGLIQPTKPDTADEHARREVGAPRPNYFEDLGEE